MLAVTNWDHIDDMVKFPAKAVLWFFQKKKTFTCVNVLIRHQKILPWRAIKKLWVCHGFFVDKHVIFVYTTVFKSIAIWKYNIILNAMDDACIFHLNGTILFLVLCEGDKKTSAILTPAIHNEKFNQNIPHYCTTWVPGNFSHARLVFPQSSSISPH